MTIDEALHHLHTYSNTLGSGQTPQAQHEEAKRVAIDVMRKYQRIVEICDTWYDKGLEAYDSIRDIIEVIEDGRIDF